MTKKLTRLIRPRLTRFSLALLVVISFSELGRAQFFVSNKGDLLAGFRKTGTFQGNYELVVNIGNITNYEALSPGTSLAVSNFAPSQLSPAFSTYNSLQWSVSAAFAGSTSW